MWQVEDERFDYSYLKHGELYKSADHYFPRLSPSEMKTSRWQMYLHAGRYIEGARDANALLAWKLYFEREAHGKRHLS